MQTSRNSDIHATLAHGDGTNKQEHFFRAFSVQLFLSPLNAVHGMLRQSEVAVMNREKAENEKQRDVKPPRPPVKKNKRHAAIERWLRREPLGRSAPGDHIWFH